jgi:hypothetical protein
MKRFAVLILLLLIAACSDREPAPTEEISTEPVIVAASPTLNPTTDTPVPSTTEALIPVPTSTDIPPYPDEGYGPTNFPRSINPLTGLPVEDANILDRRPIAMKVNIVPRSSTRPPWGLSAADIVFDYYQNSGYTRFHTIFYSDDIELGGSIRSARFPDHYLIRMYKSIFAYGSADPLINERLFGAEYSDRLVLEGGGSGLCPPTAQSPLCRFDPQGFDFLLGGTEEIHAYIRDQGIDDRRQNLDGMYFNLELPSGGAIGQQANVRYSSDDYLLWEYDPVSEEYLRFQDDLLDLGEGETFAPLIDRNNDEQISADNVVVIFMEHTFFRKPPGEIIEILVSGSGPAYAFRDGMVYETRWNIPSPDSVLYLTFPDGTSYPYKPGNTWYQVVGNASTVSNPEEDSWRFEFLIP